jgi:predicted enzyme related to lactoylglutathione lyase
MSGLPRRRLMANPFVHVELTTTELAKAKTFYSKLFDWELEDEPLPGSNGSYTMIKVGEGTGGGMVNASQPEGPSQWLAYVGVQDAAQTTRKARELGAKIVVDTMKVGDFGVMSVFEDPTGAKLAIWQPLGR